MIDKLASRLSVQKARPQSSLNEDDEESEKDELQVIDEILSTSRRHPLTDLPPTPHCLTAQQVRDTYLAYCYTQHMSNIRYLFGPYAKILITRMFSRSEEG